MIEPSKNFPTHVQAPSASDGCPPQGPEADAWAMEHVFGWRWLQMPQHNALALAPVPGPDIWCLVPPGTNECRFGARARRGMIHHGFHRCSTSWESAALMRHKIAEAGDGRWEQFVVALRDVCPVKHVFDDDDSYLAGIAVGVTATMYECVQAAFLSGSLTTERRSNGE